jgi:atypical dual specificity phosphatase
MLPNFSFVQPGVLAGSALPGYFGFSSLEEDLRDIHEEGVRVIVSLTEEPLDQSVVETEGFRYYHLPVDDHTAPPLQLMEEFCRIVAKERESGAPVLAHCFAGIGRTGTMLAAWLVWQGALPDDAIRQVRRARRGSLETLSQERAVHHFRALLVERGLIPTSGIERD